MESLLSVFTDVTVNGVALWVITLICCGVFLASFMDAIAGGGGIISVPTYLLAFHGLPTYFALGTNKLSAGIGTVFSTARFIKNGFVNWRLCVPGAVLTGIAHPLGNATADKTIHKESAPSGADSFFFRNFKFQFIGQLPELEIRNYEL